MSYPSINEIMKRRGINPETASETDLKGALWEAFETNLPLGVAYLRNVAAKVKEGGKRILQPEDPNSPLGKQLIRLVGTDVARNICQAELGVSLALYNCCGVVGAPSEMDLAMTVQEQIALQDGTLATADC